MTVAVDGVTLAHPTTSRPSIGLLIPACVLVIVGVVTIAMIGPWIAPHPVGQTIGRPFSNSGTDGIFGTDRLGRDVWSRILNGGRRIIIVPAVATLLATAVGTAAGLATARRRSTRLIDAALGVVVVIPSILVLLVFAYRFGDAQWVAVAVIIVVNLPYVTRYTRTSAAPIWASAYIEHATVRGESTAWILTHEVLPNVAGPVLADAGLRFVGSVYVVASASFLGFGPNPPATDWASMISDNIEGATLNLWAVVAPALMIAALTVPANLLADRLAARIGR